MKAVGLIFVALSFAFLLSTELINKVIQEKNVDRAEYALSRVVYALTSNGKVDDVFYENEERHIYIGKNYNRPNIKSNFIIISNSLWSSFLAKKVRMMDLKNLDYSSQAEYASVTFSGILFDECLSLKKLQHEWNSADLVTLNGYPLTKLPDELEFKTSPCARDEHSNYITLYKQIN